MACKVVWTRAAQKDVDGIAHYIAVTLDSPVAAGEHLDAFAEAVAKMGEFPEMCTVSFQRSLRVRGLRPYFVKNYVMLYSFDGADEVVVHRVFSTLQDYAAIIKNES